ncbi:MAG: ABC transporter permease [Bacteroidota bacterium]
MPVSHLRSDRRLWLLLSSLVLLISIGLLADHIAGSHGILVPFGPEDVSSSTEGFRPPGYVEIDEQGRRLVHHLGTDGIGRDVLARLIHGIPTALIIGIGSTAISLFVALLLGLSAGYFGDDRLKVGVVKLAWIGIVIFLSMFYAREFFMQDSGLGLLVVLVISGISLILGSVVINWLLKQKAITLPVDTIVQRMIEIFRAVPRLFIFLAIYAFIPNPSIGAVILLLGLVRWVAMTRIIRAETMRVSEMSYVRSAELNGLRAYRISVGHILPNIIGPIMVACSFSASTAILVESTLSFLGIGVPSDVVSWGQMLSSSREYIKAWWVAVPPGVMIFLLIILFNSIGARIEELRMHRWS